MSIDVMLDLDGDGTPEVAASSLLADRENPKRDRRGGLEIYSPRTGRVIARRQGKKAGDRLGWPILSCHETCLVGVPKNPDFFVPE